MRTNYKVLLVSAVLAIFVISGKYIYLKNEIHSQTDKLFEGHSLIYTMSVDSRTYYVYMLEKISSGEYVRTDISLSQIYDKEYSFGAATSDFKTSMLLAPGNDGYDEALEMGAAFFEKEFNGYHKVDYDRLVIPVERNDYFVTYEGNVRNSDSYREIHNRKYSVKNLVFRKDSITEVQYQSLFRDISIAVGLVVLCFFLATKQLAGNKSSS